MADDKKGKFSVVGFVIFALIISFWISSHRATQAPATQQATPSGLPTATVPDGDAATRRAKWAAEGQRRAGGVSGGGQAGGVHQ